MKLQRVMANIFRSRVSLASYFRDLSFFPNYCRLLIIYNLSRFQRKRQVISWQQMPDWVMKVIWRHGKLAQQFYDTIKRLLHAQGRLLICQRSG